MSCNITMGFVNDCNDIFWRKEQRITKIQRLFESSFYYKCDEGHYWLKYEDIPKGRYFDMIKR